MASTYLSSLSPASQRTLGHALRSIVRIALDKADDADLDLDGFNWAGLDLPTIKRIRQNLEKRYAPATVKKAMAALRGVLRVGGQLELAQAVANLDPLPLQDALPSRVVPDQEIRRLFELCARDPRPAARRDAATLAILLSAGLRRIEASALDLADYDPRQGTLRVRSVTSDAERVVALPAAAQQALADWLTERGDWSGPLLAAVNKGGRIQRRRMSDQAVYDVLARRARQANGPPITARDLRRTLVVRLIASGMDLEQVQQRVGHASWITTASYRHLTRQAQAVGRRGVYVPYLRPPSMPQETKS